MPRIALDPERTVGRIHPRVFGNFIEHLGRGIYGSIYAPGHAEADAQGYRRDTVAAIRRLAPTVLRYPGGNFVSGYHWRDGIGPAEKRPARRELAWGGMETNHFGTVEFMHLCRMTGAEPYMCVNLGSGTPEEAADWLEFCNGTNGTEPARLRQGEPYGIKLWGLGNEMYGPWQMGQKSAHDYALIARETAKLMRLIDRGVELVACGYERGPDWNITVLHELADKVEHLALHCYMGTDDFAVAMAQPLLLEHMTRANAGLVDLVLRERRLNKRIGIAWDEWNVWYRVQGDGGLEETYNLRDALAIAGCLHAFFRCADVVTLCNLAQLVNVIAPIRTEDGGVWLQTIFHPLQRLAAVAGATALDARVQCETYSATIDNFRFGWKVDVPWLDVAAMLGPDGREVTLSVVNRHHDSAVEAEIAFPGGLPSEVAVWELYGDDPLAANGPDAPARVAPRERTAAFDGRWSFPPASHTVLRW